MNTHPRSSRLQHAGTLLGKAWRGVVRREKQLTAWLNERAVPAPAATALLWTAKLVVLGILLYAAFWLALLLVFAIAVAWSTRNADCEDTQQGSEWRYGNTGYGLYTSDGYRIDPHGPEDEEP